MDKEEQREEPRPGLRLARLIPIVAVLLFLALLVFGLTTQGSSDQIDQSLADGKAPQAPRFELEILDQGSLPKAFEDRLSAPLSDGRLAVEELSGTPFVLNFWASWCDPCRQEAPILEQGWSRDRQRGVLYLGLDMQDATGDARDFLDEFQIRYPTIRDPTNETARSYGATGIPETYFVSADGRVVGHVIGVVSAQQLDDGATAAKRGELVGTLAGGARRSQR